MNPEKAASIYRAIWDISGMDLVDLRDEFIDAAIRYARIRVDWIRAIPTERVGREQERTLAHDALIDACNILSRALLQAGFSADWRAELGNDRKEIGDFACYLHYRLGLDAC